VCAALYRQNSSPRRTARNSYGLLDGMEARCVSNLQCPRQSRDRAYAGNRPQSLQSLRQQGISFQGTKQSCVRSHRAVDLLAAELQQRPNAVLNFLASRKQPVEVTFSVQAELVIADTGLHQKPGNTILHLHRLSLNKVAITKHSAPIPNFGCCDMALGQEIAPEAISDFAGVNPVVLTLDSGKQP
jgi:hypothetical protein